MRRDVLLGLIVTIGALSVAVTGYPGQATQPPPPDLVKVKGDLYVIAGTGLTFGGTSISVFITDAGVVVVDTRPANYIPQILERIGKVTEKPVTTIINTHSDHAFGNDGFPATVDIVAHENAKANMAKLPAFAGQMAQFLPKRTFKDKLSLFSGKDRIDLYYFGRGHTDGDIFVVFPEARVLQAGDILAGPGRDAPVISRNNGGSAVEFPRTLAKLLAAVKDDVDVVIPGHGPVTTLKDLEEYQRFCAEMLAAAESAFKVGQTPDQAAASINLDKYKGYKNQRVKAFMDAVYAELKK